MDLQVYRIHSSDGFVRMELVYQGQRPRVLDTDLILHLKKHGEFDINIGQLYFVRDNMGTDKFIRIGGTQAYYDYPSGITSPELDIGRQIGELVSVEVEGVGVGVSMQVVLTTALIDSFKNGKIKSLAGITIQPATVYCEIELEV